jgi:hypothetical protein
LRGGEIKISNVKARTIMHYALCIMHYALGEMTKGKNDIRKMTLGKIPSG